MYRAIDLAAYPAITIQLIHTAVWSAITVQTEKKKKKKKEEIATRYDIDHRVLYDFLNHARARRF